MNDMTMETKDTVRIAAQVTAAFAAMLGTVVVLMIPVISAL